MQNFSDQSSFFLFTDLYINASIWISYILQIRLVCSQRIPTDGFAEQNGRDAERAD